MLFFPTACRNTVTIVHTSGSSRRLTHDPPPQTKSERRLFPPTSPALLLVVLAEDAALGVGERCRVTRAMVAAPQPLGGQRRRRAEEDEERGCREDAPPRLPLSPGRKCRVRLPSSGTWIPVGAAPRVLRLLCRQRSPHGRAVAGCIRRRVKRASGRPREFNGGAPDKQNTVQVASGAEMTCSSAGRL